MILFYILIWLALASLYVALKGGLSNIARTRLYKSGTIWCAWRWTDVESEYILRLHVVKTPWFAVCLHWIHKPDAEPWLHDHPVSFLSVILRGKYAELRQREGEMQPSLLVHTWFNFIRASDKDRHRIVFTRKNTLALCFMGPKTREWGFHTQWDGWLMWKDYYAKKKQGDLQGKEAQAFLWSDLNNALGKLTDNYNAQYSGSRLFLDEETRVIDKQPAAPLLPTDFNEEAPTEPYS